MQQIPAAVLNSKPFQFFWMGSNLWRDAMNAIGAKAFARLEAINYHHQGHDLTYAAGNVLVQLNEGQVVLYPDLKRREDFEALLAANRHLAPRYPAGIPMYLMAQRPTLYRRSGWRWVLPPVCNVYYSPDWDAIASQGEAFDLGAISA